MREESAREVSVHAGAASMHAGAPPPLLALEWGECPLPPIAVPAALAAEVRKRMGARPGWLPLLGRIPWLARAVSGFAATPVAFVKRGLCDQINFVVSQDNSCRYCYGAIRSLLKIQGYGEDYIVRLERDLHAGDLSPAERVALEFARKVSRANPRPSGVDFDAVVLAGLSPATVGEVAALAAAGAFMNRVSTLVALPPETGLESLPRLPLFWLLRPLIARRMRRSPRAPEPAPRPNAGLGARIVDALDGSPMAGAYRRLIDDAFASEILPRRTKALMVAVIAKALGCRYCEDEARGLVEREGLGASDVDEILGNLASPRLDARERRLIPFARETVRYQPATIQPRVRELSQELTPEEALEMVAVAALANALGRLSIVLDVC